MKSRKLMLFLLPALLTGCGGSGDIQSEEVDKAFYEDAFNAKKLLLERNLKITVNTSYTDGGVNKTSYTIEEFDSGKVRLTRPGENDKPENNYLNTSYNAANDTLGLDWYINMSANGVSIGYSVDHQDITNPNFNSIVLNYLSLIMDIPYSEFTFKDSYYEAQNISRSYFGDTITISSFKVYFSKEFTSKITFEGIVNEDGEVYVYKSTITFSDFNKVHVELPSVSK